LVHDDAVSSPRSGPHYALRAHPERWRGFHEASRVSKVRLLLLSAPLESSKDSIRLAKLGMGIVGIRVACARAIPARFPASSRHPVLSPRQVEVLHRMALGFRIKEVAHQLGVSIKTIETHRAQLVKRLGINRLPGLVRYALLTGILPASWLMRQTSI
jgi:DNA-binding NarL/FixJ family response regulator